MNEDKTCETCRFWNSDGPDAPDAGGYGNCRRLPPSQAEFEEFTEGGAAWVGVWPATFKLDWCGEWQCNKTILSENVRVLPFKSSRVRIWKMCMRLHIETVGDLVAKREDDLLEAKGFGMAGIIAIREALACHGLKLRD